MMEKEIIPKLKEVADKLISKEEKRKKIESLIKSSLLKFIEEKEEEKELKVGVFWPSMIGECMRKVYYMYKYGLRELPERSKKITFLGTIIHEVLGEALKKYAGLEIKSEVEVNLDLGVIKIHGRADNVIFLPNENIVIEVKTHSPRKEIRTTKLSHVLQLIIYMKYFQARDGYLVYICRDDLSIRVFHIEYDEGLFSYAIQRLLNIHKYILEDREPPPEAKLDENMYWQCINCPYRKECEEKVRGIFEKTQ